MGKIFHRFLLILAIFIVFICTVSFFINGGLRKWDEQICLPFIVYTSFCTSFLIFVIIWVAAIVIIFFAILMIKSEL